MLYHALTVNSGDDLIAGCAGFFNLHELLWARVEELHIKISTAWPVQSESEDIHAGSLEMDSMYRVQCERGT